ncbi:MAG: EamA family transporter, partial [Polaromonas sp.]|nr:EamA family transporter [Polaromonas sp.]
MNKLVYPAFALLGLIWGTNFIFMKWAVVLITPAQIVLLRILFGFVPILALAAVRGSLKWSHLRHIHHFFVMALLATAIYYLAFAKGTAVLPSGIAGMLSGAIPLFSFLTAFAFLREEPINPYTLLGLALGFAGVLLIARPWSTGSSAVDVHGVLYMLGGSLSLGCSFVYARRFLVNKDISAIALSTYQIGIALLLLWVFTDLDGIGRIQEDKIALTGLVLGLGLTGTGLAYVLYYFIVQRLGALKAAGVTYIPPVIALAIGNLLVHEPLHSQDLVAMLL